MSGIGNVHCTLSGFSNRPSYNMATASAIHSFAGTCHGLHSIFNVGPNRISFRAAAKTRAFVRDYLCARWIAQEMRWSDTCADRGKGFRHDCWETTYTYHALI